MPRKADKYTLIWRKDTKKYFYRLEGWPRGKRKTTGTAGEKEAAEIALAAHEAEEKADKAPPSPSPEPTLGDLLVDAYDWDRCPHVTRLRDEGKIISPTHAKNQRRLLELYVMPDEVCQKRISEIIRGDIVSLRDRIRVQTTASQTNKAMKALRTILNERVWLQEITRNPADGVSALKENSQTVGTFTADEIAAIFRDCPGIWGDILAYGAFIMAASTGARKSEILATAWRQLDFDRKLIKIDRAFKGDGSLGLPKWEKTRICFMPAAAAKAFLEIRRTSEHVLPDSLVFCEPDGSRKGHGWWRFRFQGAMISAGFLKKN